MKNIPIAGRSAYLKRMIEKVESVIRRMRWKVLISEKPQDGDTNKAYGFPSPKTPPPVEGLAAFEDDLYNLVRSIQFTPHLNEFQKQLHRDVKEIISSKDVFISADKTPNIYRMSGDKYRKLLNDNITKSYKTTSGSALRDINHEAAIIATRLGIAGRVESYAEKEAYITIKDHKEDFPNKVSCRLINPAKSEIGKISKTIVEGINSRIRGITQLQQWRDTQSVIK